MVTAINEEVFSGVYQNEQKHTGKWREAIKVEIDIRQSETYRRPSEAGCLEGSTIAQMCKNRYPLYFVPVDVKSRRTILINRENYNENFC